MCTFVEGAISAACVSVQEKLERPLLWAACPHHIGEVVLTWIWMSLLIEALFVRLRDNFENLSFNDFSNLQFLEIQDELLVLKEQIL